MNNLINKKKISNFFFKKESDIKYDPDSSDLESSNQDYNVKNLIKLDLSVALIKNIYLINEQINIHETDTQNDTSKKNSCETLKKQSEFEQT